MLCYLTQGLRSALHPGLSNGGLSALIVGSLHSNAVCHSYRRMGLKAPNVTAWAGASPRAKAQGTASPCPSGLLGRHGWCFG